MDCAYGIAQIDECSVMENGQIFRHPAIQSHIKMLSLVMAIYLFYGLSKKIDIGEIFIGGIMRFYGVCTILEFSDLFWAINHLDCLKNNQFLQEVYEFIKFFIKKNQVKCNDKQNKMDQIHTRGIGKGCLEYKSKDYLYLKVVCMGKCNGNGTYNIYQKLQDRKS
eukprot:412375_1